MRIIAACKNCNAQYDVSKQKAHDVLHCACGGTIVVPEPRAAQARLVRCAGCGAARGTGGSNCEFCGARFSAVDKGWGSMCPGCFCRLPNDAQFCVECGLKISPRSLDAVRSDLHCPRCQCAMQNRPIDMIDIIECAHCAGMWLPVEAFQKICENKEAIGSATHGLATRGSRRKIFELTESDQVRYVPCPACKALMNRRNFGRVSGVIIDTCRDCGVWLDNQELNRIIQFIQAGGMEKARDYEARERQHSDKMRTKKPPMAAGTDLPLTLGRSKGAKISFNFGTGDTGSGLLQVVMELASSFLSK